MRGGHLSGPIILAAKILLLALFGAAVIFGLAATRCPSIHHAAQPQRLDLVLLDKSLALYAALLERVADHHRDAGRLETSVQLLHRVLTIQARISVPDGPRATRVRHKYQAQQQLLPPGKQRRPGLITTDRSIATCQ